MFGLGSNQDWSKCPGNIAQKQRHEFWPRIHPELFEQPPDEDMYRAGADTKLLCSFRLRSTNQQVPQGLTLPPCQASPFNGHHRRRCRWRAIQNCHHVGDRLIDSGDGFNVLLPRIEQSLEVAG
jgi:hypothetical protein